MTHLLIDNNGRLKRIQPDYKGLDKVSEAKLRATEEWLDFLNSEEFKVFDMVEPSNTTLMYFALAVADFIYLDHDKDPRIPEVDEFEIKKNILLVGAGLGPYLEIIKQTLDKVNPDSKTFAYGESSGLMIRKANNDDLFTRAQVMMEGIFYYMLNDKKLNIIVSEDFDMPYIMSMYASISKWNDEQYEEYDRLVKEDMAKVESESAEKTEESTN